MTTASQHHETFRETCVRALKQDGAKITNARLSVIDVLAGSKKPMTPKDVLNEVLAKSPAGSVDLVSIYRTLDKLSDLALVHEVGPSGGFLPCRHSACGHDHHVILRCTGCAKIIEQDVSETAMRPLFNFLRENQSFKVTGPAFQIDGLCVGCDGN
jgi:Fur family zinc uptake transcriptional regulator